jgi:meiotically up-regulated gene 157 (Mug157) protein
MNEKIHSPKIEEVIQHISLKDPELKKIFQKCLRNLWDQAPIHLADGRVHVVSREPGVMTLMESSQLMIPLCLISREDAALQLVIRGVIDAQMEMILTDPYASKFDIHNTSGLPGEMGASPEVKERHFSLEGVISPVNLVWNYWMSTEDDSIFDDTTLEGLKKIVEVLHTEQNHQERSEYNLEEEYDPETAPDGEKLVIRPAGATGLIWSGFRPSGKPNYYNYHIPSQMTASNAMSFLMEIFRDIYADQDTAEDLIGMQEQVNKAISQYGIIEHEKYGQIYAYESDGLGKYILMDEDEMPNLLSMPLFGYASVEDAIYQNTRKYILSPENTYYHEGKQLSGLSTSKVGDERITSHSLILQAMTEDNPLEYDRLIELIKASHGGTYEMQESLDADDVSRLVSHHSLRSDALFLELALTRLAGLV